MAINPISKTPSVSIPPANAPVQRQSSSQGTQSSSRNELANQSASLNKMVNTSGAFRRGSIRFSRQAPIQAPIFEVAGVQKTLAGHFEGLAETMDIEGPLTAAQASILNAALNEANI